MTSPAVPRRRRWWFVALALLPMRPAPGDEPAAPPPAPGRAAPEVAAQLRERDRLWEQARKLAGEGKVAEAIAAAESVLAIERRVLGEDHDDVASALDFLADRQAEREDFAAAGRSRRELVALLGRRFGAGHWQTADARRALADLKRVAEMTPADLRRLAEVTRLDRQAVAAQEQGRLPEGIDAATQALDLGEALMGPRHPATAQRLSRLASLLTLQGDYAAAKPLYERALDINQGTSGPRHPATAAGLNDLASLLMSQGDYDAARPLCEQALAICEEMLGGHHPGTAASLNTLAQVLLAQKDAAKAETLCERALAIHREVYGERHLATALSMDNLARVLLFQRDFDAAKPLCERALAIRHDVLGERHPATAESLNTLAMVVNLQGDFAAARPLYERALAVTLEIRGESHPETAAVLSNLAALLISQGDYAAAGPLMDRAMAIVRSDLNAAAAAQSERQQLAMSVALRDYLDAAASLTLDARWPGERAYRHALSWKGAVLTQQKLAHDRRPEVAELRARLRDAARRLATTTLAVPDPARQAAWRDEVAGLTRARERLEEELAALNAAFRRGRAAARRGPEAVRAALAPGMALVDLLEFERFLPLAGAKGGWMSDFERHLAAFVVRADRPVAMVDLGAVGPITRTIDHWLADIVAKRSPGGADDPAARLRRAIWGPLGPHLEGATTVLISPDGAAARIPWAALPGKAAGTYLIEDMALAVVPVPQALPDLLAPGPEDPAPKPGAGAPSLLLVGDVDFGAPPGTPAGDGSRAAARDDRAGALGHFLPLEAARDEVLAIKDSFEEHFDGGRVSLLRKAKATESAFREQAPAHRFLHLATHGFFAPPGLKSALAPEARKPGGAAGPARAADPFGGAGIVGFHPGLLSGIALAGADRPPEPGKDDGILTALEVAELDLAGTDLVVLSACETGLGQSAGGEGLLGLQRAFQVAGAGAVVASLWKVGDRPTQALMARFYENLWKDNKGRLESLREAQLWMLREGRDRNLIPEGQGTPAGRPERTPPFYWAAFVLSGDWR